MHYLSGKEKKELISNVPEDYQISKKDNFYIKENILYKNDIPYFILKEDKYVPHLKSLIDNVYKSVYIDHGAVPFLVKGADMMRPGIQEIEEGFEKEEIIIIRDEVHKKALGIGEAMFSSSDMKAQTSGKSVKVLHHMKDEYFQK